jgi:restriction system protein
MSDRKPLSALASGPVAVALAILAAVATAAVYRGHVRRERGGRGDPVNTLDLSAARLQALTADEFRDICKAYYYSRQFRLRAVRVCSDARDAVLYFGTLPYPVAIVRIIAPAANPIDVDAIRDLTEVMALHAVAKGIVHAPGGYTDAAVAYARGNRIRLVSGEDLVRNISGMPDGARTAMATLLTPAPADATH